MRPIVQLVALALALAIPLAAAPPKKARTKAKPSPLKEEPAQPPRPIAPMTAEQLPATPPQVSFLNGQLTIQSENSTLSDILAAIRARTGAQIEAPPTSNERVFGRFGPGPAQQVITALLTGSKYDFIVLGSNTVAGGVQRVILTPRRSGTPGGTPPPAEVASAQPAVQDYEPDSDEEPEVPERVEEEPPPPPTETQPAGSAPPAQQGGGAPNQATQPQAPGQSIGEPIVPRQAGQEQQGQGQNVKTPDQLLQELQRLQQQQQQQQQNQNQNPNNPR